MKALREIRYHARVDEDFALLERWRAGERAAGEELFRRHFDEINRFFGHKVPEDADDLTQRTFLSIVKAPEQFRGLSRFRTYLFAIARNEFNHWLRRKPEHQHVDLEVSSLNELVSSPSKQLGRQEELAQLRAALGEIPVEQQQLLELRYWHDLDIDELAAMYEVPPGTVRVRLLRAREALRKRLEKLGMRPTASDRLSRVLAEPEAPSESL